MVYNALIQNEITLQHHGIRGMKWGRRKQAHRDTPLPNLSSNTSLNTGLFKYDNPDMPTRRDYAQFLARDARVLSKMSREVMVTQMGSKDPKKVNLAYNEALARSYGKGALAGMRDSKISNLTLATAGGVGAAFIGALHYMSKKSVRQELLVLVLLLLMVLFLLRTLPITWGISIINVEIQLILYTSLTLIEKKKTEVINK